MQQKVFFKDSNGLKVCGILSDPKSKLSDKSPILIMSHGLGMSKDIRRFLAMQDVLNNKGIATLRIDLFGHGESDGEFEDLTATKSTDDILKAIEFLKKKGYKKIALAGGSFGGFVSLLAASKTKYIKFLLLVSPASTYSFREIVTNGRRLIRKWREFDYKRHVEGDDRNRKFKYTFFKDFMSYDPLKVAKDVKVPVLIIHGSKDDVIPLEKSVALINCFEDCLLLVVGGADHEYTGKYTFNRIIELATDFVIDKFND